MLIQLDVNIPAPLAPIFLPNNPDIIALNKGINNTNITWYIHGTSMLHLRMGISEDIPI